MRNFVCCNFIMILDKYLDHSDFQMCEMDNNSAYIAIARESIESLVKPELR